MGDQQGVRVISRLVSVSVAVGLCVITLHGRADEHDMLSGMAILKLLQEQGLHDVRNVYIAAGSHEVEVVAHDEFGQFLEFRLDWSKGTIRPYAPHLDADARQEQSEPGLTASSLFLTEGAD